MRSTNNNNNNSNHFHFETHHQNPNTNKTHQHARHVPRAHSASHITSLLFCFSSLFLRCLFARTLDDSPKPTKSNMYRDVSSCNTYNYGDALYWNARYVQEGGSFDWYQRYSALRPFVRKYIPTSSRVLMVGCGNARNFSSTSYLFFCFFYFVFVVPFF